MLPSTGDSAALERPLQGEHSMNVSDSVKKLISLVEQRKFLEAIQEFYADNASMQENNAPPRAGLATLLENERKFLTTVKSTDVSRAESFLVDGNRVAIHWIFEFTNLQGQKRRLEEIAYQLWQDGKIVRERFFYDPKQN
jgi:SnoaL-like polyketide cyclase